jgi:hypothetical protein
VVIPQLVRNIAVADMVLLFFCCCQGLKHRGWHTGVLQMDICVFSIFASEKAWALNCQLKEEY